MSTTTNENHQHIFKQLKDNKFANPIRNQQQSIQSKVHLSQNIMITLCLQLSDHKINKEQQNRNRLHNLICKLDSYSLRFEWNGIFALLLYLLYIYYVWYTIHNIVYCCEYLQRKIFKQDNRIMKLCFGCWLLLVTRRKIINLWTGVE